MATEIDGISLAKPRVLHFEWVWPMFRHPRQTLDQILLDTRGNWLTPLLILSVLALITILIAGPIRQASVQSTPPTPPADFQYWSPEQQQQFMTSTSTSAGPMFVYFFPAMAVLLRIWVGWFLLAAVLHLVLTLSGSRSSMALVLNLVGWASLPMAIRFLVQAGGLLSTHTLIASPGLAGFAPAGGGTLNQFIAAVLPLIDLYLLWSIALLLAGLIPLAGMTRGKAWISVVISEVIVLVLLAVPGFIGAQFSGLSTIRPFGF